MKLERLAISSCAALALTVMALDADAGGRRGHHRHHFHSRALFVFPVITRPLSYYPSRPWYYCPASNAYYPYVQDCPGGWVPVTPVRPPQG